jgi:hypothetical protein
MRDIVSATRRSLAEPAGTAEIRREKGFSSRLYLRAEHF